MVIAAIRNRKRARGDPDRREIRIPGGPVALAIRDGDGWRLHSCDGTPLSDRSWPRVKDCALEHEVMDAMKRPRRPIAPAD
jgi:hypothetical protein